MSGVLEILPLLIDKIWSKTLPTTSWAKILAKTEKRPGHFWKHLFE